jgi:polyisoprenyl-phosphate glycosyltransferase
MSKPDSTVVLSIVIPVFNEEEVLSPFINRLLKVVENISETCELILVDDGSQDKTYDKICQWAEADKRIMGLRFSRNFGKEAAMLAGLEHAVGKAVVIMDGDGQHPPELLPEMIAPWRSGEADIVCAFKRGREKDTWLARIMARVFNALMKSMTGLDLTGASDYRLMDRKVVKDLLRMKERVRFFRGLTSWTGYREMRIPFDVSERMGGESGWTSRQLVQLAITAITSFTAKPLTWVFGMGTFGILISVVLGIQALVSHFSGVAVSGWTSLTIVILFFGSANLIGTGLVGIYLARVFDEVKARPIYLIQSTIGKRSK